MNTPRKILTVYKEEAYGSVGVCIFNFFYHISISLLHGADEVINFPFKEFLLLSSNSGDSFRQMDRNGIFSTNCQRQEFTITLYTE